VAGSILMQHNAVDPAVQAHLVVVPRGPRLGPHAWSSLLARLPAGERHRVQQLRRWEDRQDSAIGWDLIGQFAARHGVSVLRAASGRPVADLPVDISLSHGAGWIAVAGHVSGRVGVDVEGARHVPPTLTRRCLASPELSWLDGAADRAGRSDRFLRLWTAKEAYLKATGTGLDRDPRTCATDCSGPAPRLLGADGDRWQFRSSSPAAGVHVTVCWEREP
jgi:hypothetical protein